MNHTLWLVLIGVAVVLGVAVLLVLPGPSAASSSVVETVPEATTNPEVVTIPEVSTAPEVATAPEASTSAETTTPSAVHPVSYLVDGVIGPSEYAHSTQVAGVTVYWVNDSQALQVGMVAPGHGYVAFGIDPEFAMKGANMVLVAVDAEGQVVARDDYGIGTMSHAADVDSGGMDDILSVAGSETADQTTVEFVIPLDSGDPFDKPLTAGETYGLLVAYNATSDDFTQKHTSRGTGEITLDPAP